jgi:acyl-CoA thioesterase I
MKIAGWRLGASIAFLTLALAATAQADTIKIVAFGHSGTFGKGVAPNEAYPAQLEAALKAKGYDVRVKNAGINGDTTAGALDRLDADIPQETQIVIVAFGINDARAGIPAAKIDANLEEIVSRLRARGIEVLLHGLPDNETLRSFARAQGALYFEWDNSHFPNKYKLDLEGHLNPEGYAIEVGKMMPLVEELIARVQHAKN